MGLDMTVYETMSEIPTLTDFDTDTLFTRELHYWRKHPNLHGWMEALYKRKGGVQDLLNCTPVQLTLTDIDELEQAIKSKTLPFTEGFFFGVSTDDEEALADDLLFIEKAKEALSNAYNLYYECSW